MKSKPPEPKPKGGAKQARKQPPKKGAVEKRRSKYIGVSWHMSKAKYGPTGKWRVAIRHEGVQRTLRSFPANKEKAAAKCYDEEARRLRGAKARVNFPKAGEKNGAAITRRTAEQVAADQALAGVRKSQYVGVSWSGKSGKWHVAIRHNGVQRALGFFPAEQEMQAAKCYDKEARRLRGAKAKLNFPRAGEKQGAARTMRTQEQKAVDKALGSVRKSKYVGVSWSGKSGKWQVAISHNGMQRTLGTFSLEQEKQAAKCYDAAARSLRGPDHGWLKLNFPRAGEVQGAAKAKTRRTAEQKAAAEDTQLPDSANAAADEDTQLPDSASAAAADDKQLPDSASAAAADDKQLPDSANVATDEDKQLPDSANVSSGQN